MRFIGYDEKDAYFSSWVDAGYTVFKYCYTDDTERLIYECSDIFSVSFSMVLDEKVYLVVSKQADAYLQNYLIAINAEGTSSRQLFLSSKIPQVSFVEESFFAYYEKIEKDKIVSCIDRIRIDTFKQMNIDTQECKVSDTGTLKGDYLLYCGGLNDGLYYQKLKLDNQQLEQSKVVALMYYDIKNDEALKVAETESIYIFLTGTKDYLILSEYIYNPPFYDTGKFIEIVNSEWRYMTIPDITAGEDILNVYYFDTEFLIISPNILYVFCPERKSYERIDIGNGIEEKTSSIQKYKSTVGYIRSNSSETTLVCLKLG